MQSIESNESGRNHADDFEIREMVDNCLATLPPVQKSIILLRDLEGYNYKEISEILDLTESQVKVYLFRARNKVKKQIKSLTSTDKVLHA
jgi:RNA polymerase sigma-70 factor (ECF subfamily)